MAKIELTMKKEGDLLVIEAKSGDARVNMILTKERADEIFALKCDFESTVTDYTPDYIPSGAMSCPIHGARHPIKYGEVEKWR